MDYRKLLWTKIHNHLHRQAEQVLDYTDLSKGGGSVERRVSSLVLTADLRSLLHQQTHHIQMTCRSQKRAR